ncbi:MAG: hypothetical protein COZ23_10595 [Hydrogenophilales bacterium CG_4_10_14_3_um_filter_58_23]|nr:MAG: hypothetical protein COX55_00105 [Zetaproteobacteria bacterium CG23_combo_of_CG06-09_8_20_14_all_54_7]PIX99626.1 MAG: hypothetical protein COZ23_10595 [Hydrogenophilales bacterium CG_4_10_14_3_um_filter_58_23]
MMPFREPLIYSSPRRKPGSSLLILLDSGFRRNDGTGINQRFLSNPSLMNRVVIGASPFIQHIASMER